MSEHGAAWQQPLAGTLSLGRTNRWFLGGGKALLNAYYRTAHKMGISVRYDAMVEDLAIENGRFEAVALKWQNGTQELVRARAVVLAAGGYEANIEWLKRHWGDAAENFIVRGTPYNDGTMLAALLKQGRQADGRSERFSRHRRRRACAEIRWRHRDASGRDSVWRRGEQTGRRFYDEGEAIWPKRYAIWGGLIAAQPDQLGLCDRGFENHRQFLAADVQALSGGVDRGACGSSGSGSRSAFVRNDRASTIARLPAERTMRMETPDGNGTRGISPPKSNWAIPINRPPFYALPLRPGITFTYMGVAVDETGRVLDQSGRPFPNVYAAGEIMSGNILTKGYLAGFGMTIGSVFGELAGRMAATNARA